MTVEALVSDFRDERFTFKDAFESLEKFPKVNSFEQFVEDMSKQWY